MSGIGIKNVRRLSVSNTSGIVGDGFAAGVVFDPLPMSDAELFRIHDWASGRGLSTLCLNFAGWDQSALDLAAERRIALFRFTFAGHVEPSNSTAAGLVPD